MTLVVAVVCPGLALINVMTIIFHSTSGITYMTFTFICPYSVFAIGMHVTVMHIVYAFVEIAARETIAIITSSTLTLKRTLKSTNQNSSLLNLQLLTLVSKQLARGSHWWLFLVHSSELKHS